VATRVLLEPPPRVKRASFTGILVSSVASLSYLHHFNYSIHLKIIVSIFSRYGM
jgi:hypothetical protein